MDALKSFPKTNVWLQTEKGPAVFQKMDIFKGWVWYAYKENPVNWHKLDRRTDQSDHSTEQRQQEGNKSGRICHGT